MDNGTAANATHTRTFLYLTQADLHVRQLYDERGQDIARLVTGWNAFVGDNVDAESCPVAPFFIVRLFFRFLPDLPVSLGMRDGIARISLISFSGDVPDDTDSGNHSLAAWRTSSLCCSVAS